MCITKKRSHIFFKVTKLRLAAKAILAIKGYKIPLHPQITYSIHVHYVMDELLLQTQKEAWSVR